MNIWLLGPRFRGDERRLWLRMYPPHCVALLKYFCRYFGSGGGWSFWIGISMAVAVEQDRACRRW